jgi:hypothetical protein
MVVAMMTPRDPASNTTLMMLETAAASARSGFGCMFSSSDEFETALISARRAEGRYGTRRSRWPLIAFVGCCAIVAATVLVLA